MESKTLNLWERIAEQQAYADHPDNVLALPMLLLIDVVRKQQKLIDQWNEPEAAQRLTATDRMS